METRLTTFLLLLAVLLVGCSSNEQDTPPPAVSALPDSVTYEFVAADSGNVLDLTQSRYDIDVRTTAMGAFLTAIDSIESSRSAFWVYSVNGAMADIAASAFLAAPGDTIRWHFRRATD